MAMTKTDIRVLWFFIRHKRQVLRF